MGPPTVSQVIMSKCRDLCKKGERIIYLAESGSRSWGYDSEDSDYDVRGIFVKTEPYVYSAIAEDNNTILECIDGEFDILLWDIVKVLQLYYKKCNQTIVWWLTSDIVYYETDQSRLLKEFVLARNVKHVGSIVGHYYGVAQDSLKKYRHQKKVKKYIYMWRAILCARWAIRHGTNPPQNINTLLEFFDEQPLKEHVQHVLSVKRANDEQHVVAIHMDEPWIQDQLASLRKYLKEHERNRNEFDDEWKSLIDSLIPSK